MFQSSQILNTQLKKHNKNGAETFDTFNNHPVKTNDKVHSTETSVGDISQDLIKQLTLKNKLLNAQLTEYKTLVANLNARLQHADQQNLRLRDSLMAYGETTPKLHTIEQQLNSMSQITTKSRRRDQQQMKQQYYFHQFTQLLNSHQLISQNMNWEAYLSTVEGLLDQRKEMVTFVARIQEMKNSIEPQNGQGQGDLLELWEWVKKIGLNYYYLLNHRKVKDKKDKQSKRP